MIAPSRRFVVDASMAVELLLRSGRGAPLRGLLDRVDTELCVPTLCDVEVGSALRRLSLSGRLGEVRLQEALDDYGALSLRRFTPLHLLSRVLELRHNFTAYDAVYVALAEGLDAELCTADTRLATAVQEHTSVPVV